MGSNLIKIFQQKNQEAKDLKESNTLNKTNQIHSNIQYSDISILFNSNSNSNLNNNSDLNKEKTFTNFTLIYPIFKEMLSNNGITNFNQIKKTNKSKFASNNLSFEENEMEAFSLKIVEEINRVRMNLSNYGKLVDLYGKLIQTEKNTGEKLIPIKINNINYKYFIPNGQETFNEAGKILQKLHKKMNEGKKCLDLMEKVSELEIPFPEDLEKIFDYEVIKLEIEEIRRKVNGSFVLTNFHFDIFTDNLEFCILLKVVCDVVSDKIIPEGLLMNRNKYVGINLKKISDMYIVYFLFGY